MRRPVDLFPYMFMFYCVGMMIIGILTGENMFLCFLMILALTLFCFGLELF